MHYATGMRTDQCEDIINYIAALQSKSLAFNDAVEYLSQHINRLQELEEEKVERDMVLLQTKGEKEQLFLTKYDLERRLAQLSQSLEQSKKAENGLEQKLSLLQKKYQERVRECESLTYRLNHFQDISSMMEPPNLHQSIINEITESAEAKSSNTGMLADADATEKGKVVASEGIRPNFQEDRMKGLEQELNIMKKLLEEKQQLSDSSNGEHFIRIQELFNKQQMENKSLRQLNQKVESKLESKERLIDHLEGKVTTIMLDKEEIIVKLKSEIVLFKNQIDANDQKFDQKLAQERQKFEKGLQKQYKDQIASAQIDVVEARQQRDDSLLRLSQLQSDYDRLSVEYANFRENKVKSEKEREAHLFEIETKLQQISEVYEGQVRGLEGTVAQLENRVQVVCKENSILELKLKYVKESTEILLKQKLFISDNIEKSCKQLEDEKEHLASTMMDENQNRGDYLISVKKALAQSQNMLDMGMAALQNLQQITTFLKVEELLMMVTKDGGNLASVQQYQQQQQRNNSSSIELVLNTDNPNIEDEQNIHLPHYDYQQQLQMMQRIEKADDDTTEAKNRFNSKRSSEQTHIEPVQGLKLQKFQSAWTATPPNFDFPSQSQNLIKIGTNNGERNDEYFFLHCPIEMSSILLKVLADVLMFVVTPSMPPPNGESPPHDAQNSDYYSSPAMRPTLLQHDLKVSVPPQLQLMLDLANEKSDVQIENEIFERYLQDTKQMIEDQIQLMRLQHQISQQQVNELLMMQEAGVGDLEPSPSLIPKHYSLSAQYQTPNPQTLLNRDDLLPIGAGRNKEQVDVSPFQMMQSQDQRAAQEDIASIGDHSQKHLIENRHKSMILSPVNQFKLGTGNGGMLGNYGMRAQHTMREHSMGSHITPTQQQQQLQQKKPRKSTRGEKKSARNIEIEQLRLQLQVQKQGSKDLQLQLASKIVALEEQIDELIQERLREGQELAAQHRQELEMTRVGIQQREKQILQRMQKQIDKHQQNEDQLQQYQLDVTKMAAELQELREKEKNFGIQLEERQKELAVYKENVSSYVNLRVSQRSTFSLAFEASSSNISMINEAMLKYYLRKCFRIDKDKFRFLSTTEHYYSINNDAHNEISAISKAQLSSTSVQSEQITVIKILIEIVGDQTDIDNCLSTLKLQIMEGTCLLYDIDPLYIGINLGSADVNHHSLLSDYYLISRKGNSLNDQPFIVSVMRHSVIPMAFKVLATSCSGSGETYTLDLTERDLIELTESGMVNMLELQEPMELIEIITSNLGLITKDNVTYLVCEHKIFFCGLLQDEATNSNDLLNSVPQQNLNPYSSISPYINKKKLLAKSSKGINIFRQSAVRNLQITRSIVSKSELVNDVYQHSLLTSQQVQTEFEPGLLYEQFTQVFQCNQRLGKQVEFKLQLLEGHDSKIQQLLLEEIVSRQRIQVCFYPQQRKTYQEAEGKEQQQYFIYSEILQLSENSVVLVSAEKLQEDGFLVKLHDLKELASEEFFLQRKSNGQYSRLSRNAGLEMVMKEDFRNLIFDLTFAINAPSKQVLQANMAYHKEILALKGNDQETGREDQLLQLPNRKRKDTVQVTSAGAHSQFGATSSSVIDRIQSTAANNYRYISDKGMLLYRNIYTVRCSFEEAEEIEQSSLISFYLKRKEEEEIAVEVFLYKDAQKMSIASQVNVQDLFGADFGTLNFSQRTELLDQMMEKLYVLSENQTYHLKVENEAVPISLLLQQRKLFKSSDTNSLSDTVDRGIIDQRIKEINLNKNGTAGLDDSKVQQFTSFALINNKVYDFHLYFLMKQAQDNIVPSSPKKKYTQVKRLQMERQATANIESMVEDYLDYDCIYVELTDRQEEQYNTLVDQRGLLRIIGGCSDRSTSLFVRNKEKLAEFIKQQTMIDSTTGLLRIEAWKDNSAEGEEQDWLFKCSTQNGGYYMKRKTKDKQMQTNSHLMEERLLMNSEVEMAEFAFDIKLYENVELARDKLISYTIEIFNLNDPDITYRYNHTVSHQSASLQTAMEIGLDLFNLIDHPFKQDSASSAFHQDQIAASSIESVHKKNFQQLFNKYIDNRLMLIVQEQKFPNKIGFSIVESSSQLQWSYQFDPLDMQNSSGTHLGNRLGSLSIMDAVLMERYLMLLHNELSVEKIQQRCLAEVSKQGSWSTPSSDNTVHVDGYRFKEGYDLTICQQSKLLLVLVKPTGSNEYDFLVEGLSSGGYSPEGAYSSQRSSQLKQQRAKIQDIVLLRIDMSREYTLNSKIIKLQASSEESFLMLQVSIQKDRVRVWIKDLSITDDDSGQLLFLFQLTSNKEMGKKTVIPKKMNLYSRSASNEEEAVDEEGLSEQSSKNQIDFEILTENFTQQMKVLNSDNFVKEYLKLFQESLLSSGNAQEGQYENGLTNDQLSIAGRSLKEQSEKLSSRNSGASLVLHRKTFYDETQEKLIIVSVQAEYGGSPPKNEIKNKKQKQSFERNSKQVTHFGVKIYEPESESKSEFSIQLEQCFLPEELFPVDRTDLGQLKKLAKLLVEERAIIKRNEHDSQYTVDINLAQNSLDIQSSIEAEDIKNLVLGQAAAAEKNQQQIAEMSEEEDEEEQLVSKQEIRLQQQSIIQEECSQEDEEDSPEVEAKRRHNPMEIDENQHSPGDDFTIINQTAEEDNQMGSSILHTDNHQLLQQNEHELNLILVKDLSQQEVLEIFEEEVPPHSNSFSFIIRKKNTVDDRVTSERLLNEEQVRQLIGAGEVGDVRLNKAKVVEMLIDYASHHSLDESMVQP